MEIWETLHHALEDTLLLVPILLVVYFLIELLEYKKAISFERSKLLKGKISPIFGSLFGCVPQCGFSVVSTDLYSKKNLSVGALIAVYVSTSDEAIPLMLADYTKIPDLLLLILVKVLFGIALGYLSMLLYKKIFKNSEDNVLVQSENSEHIHKDEHEHHHCEDELVIENESCEVATGCCKHNVASEKFDFKHPLLHCLKITLFILIINIIFGFLVMLIGEDNLKTFLQSNSALQPLLAVLIGLIPNCASSVVITELYLKGLLSFGSIVAGLSVNAGIALTVLFKQNKNMKENLFILAMLIVPSLIFGYALHFIF